ncbi:thiol peroxidase [Vibrio sp. D420a]|uniref:thiol peroxidase n=1 Tax=Vibrio sp. D420a TaxID=2836895 RepID=UPI00255678DF|nr:thiol peroxidase [Vibrio sp. D420a]MDK9764475.1 thiol peroxidase [Vibrio sp. D420a]
MNKVTFLGEEVVLAGNFPSKGEQLITPELCTLSLNPLTISDVDSKYKLIYLFPSIDTPVCAATTKSLAELAQLNLKDVSVYTVSADLPFALARYNEASEITNVEHLSVFKDAAALNAFGVEIKDHALTGLASRAVILLDSENKVIHSELVSEITEAPNFNLVVEAIQG